MEWVVPILSAVIVVEWAVIWLRRRHHGSDADRVAGLDVLITFVGVVLLISSVQYLTHDVGEAARIAVNVLRVVLFGTGAYVLWDQRNDQPDS